MYIIHIKKTHFPDEGQNKMGLKKNKLLNELSLNISIDAQLNKVQGELMQAIITCGTDSFIEVYSPTIICSNGIFIMELSTLLICCL